MHDLVVLDELASCHPIAPMYAGMVLNDPPQAAAASSF